MIGLFEKIYAMTKDDDVTWYEEIDVESLSDFHIFNLTNNAVNMGASKIINRIIEEEKIVLAIRPLIDFCLKNQDEKIIEYVVKHVDDYNEVKDIYFDSDTDQYKLDFLSRVYNKVGQYVDFVKKCKEKEIEYRALEK